MSAGVDSEATSPAFTHLVKLPIVQLSPDTEGVEYSYIEASVALVWPYSSSNKRISLLLVENDVRLRKSKGQVKVTFHGECAREVAKTHVGIGDHVKLGLKNATWTKTGEKISTPGKKVDWDLEISKRITLEVSKTNGTFSFIDHTARSPSPTIIKASVIETESLKTKGLINIRKSGLSGNRFSPARNLPNHISSGIFLDPSLDPFVVEDETNNERARKRTKFARPSGSWQLLDDENDVVVDEVLNLPSSPLAQETETELPQNLSTSNDLQNDQGQNLVGESLPIPLSSPLATDVQHVSDLMEDVAIPAHVSNVQFHTDTMPRSDTIMPPPPIPSADRPVKQPLMQLDNLPKMTPTPVLRPLLSPGLPLVSPMVENSLFATGYFLVAESLQGAFEPSTGSIASVSNSSIAAQSITLMDGSAVVQDHLDNGSPVEDVSDKIPDNAEHHSHETAIFDVVMQVEPNSALSERLGSVSPQQVTPLVDDNTIQFKSSIENHVDLDALQQQIEANNESWQSSSQAPQVEDEDMYGPPVHVGSWQGECLVMADKGNENVSQNGPDMPQLFNSVLSEKLTSTDVPIQETMQPATITENVAQKFTISTVAVISSSEDEGNESNDTHEVTESDSESLESMTHDIAETEELSDSFSTEEVSDSGDEEDSAEAEEDMEANGFIHDPNVETTAALGQQTENGLCTPIDVLSPARQSTNSSEQQPISQSDGFHETFEDEDQRNRLRVDSIYDNGLLEEEVVNILSSSPKSNGSLDKDDSTKQDFSYNTNRDDEAEPTLQASDPGILDTLEAEIVQDTTNVTTNPTESHISDSKDELVPRRHRYESYTQIVTPNATQQGLEEAAFPEVFVAEGQHPYFPPTPELTQPFASTQDQHDRSKPSSPLTTEIPIEHDVPVVSPTSPVNAVGESETPRRMSPRLSRRSFASEQVSTEYFTPRRSLRLGQSSPSFVPSLPPSSQQPASPIRTKRVLRSSSPATTRQVEELLVQTSKPRGGATTSLSYFPHLSTLHNYFNLEVDILAVCSADTSQPVKAKNGPKDHFVTLHLADSSFLQDNTTVSVQIFRPKQAALPVAKRGDIILLRNMKVQTHKHKVVLSSTDSSAWVVFKQALGKIHDVAVNGPPVEYNEAEEAIVDELLSWWMGEGREKYPEFSTSNDHGSGARETRSTSPRITRSQKRKANMTDHLDNALENHSYGGTSHDNSEPPSSPPIPVPLRQNSFMEEPSSPMGPGKQYNHRRNNSRRSESLVHELRDGTTYVDDDSRQRGSSVVHELRDGSTYIDE